MSVQKRHVRTHSTQKSVKKEHTGSLQKRIICEGKQLKLKSETPALMISRYRCSITFIFN